MPLANESVIFGVPTLMKSGAGGGGHGMSGGANAANRSAPQTNCTLIEFLVLKHPFEWNNFTERIGFCEAVASVASVGRFEVSEE